MKKLKASFTFGHTNSLLRRLQKKAIKELAREIENDIMEEIKETNPIEFLKIAVKEYE